MNYFKTIISKGKETNKIIVGNKKPFREVEVKLKK